jgi:hypothetical protein
MGKSFGLAPGCVYEYERPMAAARRAVRLAAAGRPRGRRQAPWGGRPPTAAASSWLNKHSQRTTVQRNLEGRINAMQAGWALLVAAATAAAAPAG